MAKKKKKVESKNFVSRLLDKLDSKMEKASKKGCCCCDGSGGKKC